MARLLNGHLIKLAIRLETEMKVLLRHERLTDNEMNDNSSQSLIIPLRVLHGQYWTICSFNTSKNLLNTIIIFIEREGLLAIIFVHFCLITLLKE